MPLSTKLVRRLSRLLLGVVGVAVLAILAVQFDRLPSRLMDAPLFIAPMLTMFVASFALGDFVLDLAQDPALREETLKVELCLCSGIALVSVLGVCCVLVSFTTWFWHLICLGLLFVLFLLWDFVVLSLLSEGNRSHRDRIAWGNRLVNRPTIGAIVFALVFLGAVTRLEGRDGSATRPLSVSRGHSMAEQEPQEGDEAAEGESSGGGDKTRQDTFVTGLVFFHLVAAACSYLASFFSELKDGSVLGRIGYHVFYWTPKGSPSPKS